jgi:hypothetical protein
MSNFEEPSDEVAPTRSFPSGALSRDDKKRMTDHAYRYYREIKNRKTDSDIVLITKKPISCC